RISAAADGPRLRRHLPHQVAAANQSGGPVLHELQRLRASSSGRERYGVELSDRTQVGHHFPVWWTAVARPWLLRDQRPGLVRWRRHQAGGSLHRWRQEMEQGRVQGNAAAYGAYPFQLSV